MARRLVTTSVTSHDYDVIVVTSQYSKSSHLETIEPESTIRADPLSAHYRIFVLKICSLLIRLRTLGEEALGITLTSK